MAALVPLVLLDPFNVNLILNLTSAAPLKFITPQCFVVTLATPDDNSCQPLTRRLAATFVVVIGLSVIGVGLERCQAQYSSSTIGSGNDVLSDASHNLTKPNY